MGRTSWWLVLFLLGGVVFRGIARQETVQPFYKNPQWLNTIRVSGLMQLWAWENRKQWWQAGLEVTYHTKHNVPNLFSSMRKETLISPAEYFYYSHYPEARFYPPEVEDVLNREIGGISGRINISPVELADAAVRFYQKYHYRPVLDAQVLQGLTPRQMRILKILWKKGFLTDAALYQQFVKTYPDEAIAFPLFEKEIDALASLALVRRKQVGQIRYVVPRVSRAYVHYSLRELFRNLDPITHAEEYAHVQKLLAIIEE